MRTITTTLYSFEELARPVQEKIIARERERLASMADEIDGDLFYWTLRELEEALHIQVYDWGVTSKVYRFRFSFTSVPWFTCSPKYLLRYLNAIEGSFRSGKYYSCRFRKHRESKVLFTYDEALTDEWSDHGVTRAWATRWDAVRKGYTIGEFVQYMLDAFFTSWKENKALNRSDDNIRDILENGYDHEAFYLEDGMEWTMPC